MVDGAVLAGGVPALQADQQRALALGVHQVLQVAQLLGVGLDLGQGVLVGLVLVLEAGVDLAQIDLAARLHAELLVVVHRSSTPFGSAAGAAGGRQGLRRRAAAQES